MRSGSPRSGFRRGSARTSTRAGHGSLTPGATRPRRTSTTGAKLNFEQVAELQPDLILGLYAGLDAGQYEALSQIAPTVAQSADHAEYTTPWTEMTRTAGRVLGKSTEAEQLIDDIEESFAEVRAAHPEFADDTSAVVDVNGGEFWLFASGDPRGTFVTSLGFQPDADADAFAADTFGASLSQERMDLLDVDRLVVLGDTASLAALADNALYQQLAVVKEGRVIEVPYAYDGPEAGLPSIGAAMSYNTVLSIPYAIEHFIQLLPA
ncbi:MAG: ABC transporter substrate-binding protein [Ilumatobacteraceae bacterium]